MNAEKLKPLARDLRKTPPRSPRQTLGGFVIAARMLDKARADLLAINGEYNYYPCGLGAYFWKFTGLDAAKFKDFVATGATDEEVDRWLRDNATQKDPKAIIKWNNEMIGLRLCDLNQASQEYLETYIPQSCPPPRQVKFFLDGYDGGKGVRLPPSKKRFGSGRRVYYPDAGPNLPQPSGKRLRLGTRHAIAAL